MAFVCITETRRYELSEEITREIIHQHQQETDRDAPLSEALAWFLDEIRDADCFELEQWFRTTLEESGTTSIESRDYTVEP